MKLFYSKLTYTVGLLLLAIVEADNIVAAPTMQTVPPAPSISVYIVIKTDNYPTETSFKVIDQNGLEVMAGGSYTKQLSEYVAAATLPGANNVYRFTIYDTYGDGLCCVYGQGGYNLFLDGKLARTGGIFTKSETTAFQAGPGPTPAPTQPPTPLPTTPPTVGPNISVYIIIRTDNYPAETSFKVFDQDGVEVMAGGPFTKQLTEYVAAATLPRANNVYRFTVYDTFGDGLCCAYGNGGYNLFVDGYIMKTGGIFGKGETTTFPSKPTGPKVYEENQKPKYIFPVYEKSEVEHSINIAKDSEKGGKENDNGED